MFSSSMEKLYDDQNQLLLAINNFIKKQNYSVIIKNDKKNKEEVKN